LKSGVDKIKRQQTSLAKILKSTNLKQYVQRVASAQQKKPHPQSAAMRQWAIASQTRKEAQIEEDVLEENEEDDECVENMVNSFIHVRIYRFVN